MRLFLLVLRCFVLHVLQPVSLITPVIRTNPRPHLQQQHQQQIRPVEPPLNQTVLKAQSQSFIPRPTAPPPRIPSILLTLPRNLNGSNTVAATNLGHTFDKAKRIRSFASVSQNLNTVVANEQLSATVHPVFETSEDKQRKFGSLEFKKHRCYSPTFYSMRCKKHAKRRPVIYAIPKDCKKSKSSDALFVFKGSSNFENLTDSIQVMEQKPKPKPRCKRHRRNSCRIYENIKDVLEKDTNTTHAVVHKSDSEVECYNTEGSGCKRLNASLHKSAPDIFNNHVKVSPTRVKPATVSPKGALYMQLKAKRRTPPNPELILNSNDNPTPKNSKDVALSVPQMPLMEPKSMWSSKLNKVCFFSILIALLTTSSVY